jgi:membrane protein
MTEWMGRIYRRVAQFLARDIWTLVPGTKKIEFLLRVVRTLVLVFQGFRRGDLFLLSGALTYKTAFALVPLLAVMLAFFHRLGGLAELGERVKNFVLDKLDPSAHGEFAGYLDRFIEQFDAPAIGAVGLVVLAWTAFSLLGTIETAFNRIWGIRNPRRFLRRMATYWIILTLTPVLLAVSLAAAAFFQSQPLMERLAQTVPSLNAFLVGFASFVFAWLLFLAVYLVMPNTRVHIGAALIGAVVAGTLWEITKGAYVWYHARVVTAYEVYGSLGAIPVFLLWVYLSWALVLFGGELAFAIQHSSTYRREIEVSSVSQQFKERLGLLLTLRVTRAFLRAEPAPTAEALAMALDTPIRLVHEVVHQLAVAGVLRESHDRKGRTPGMIPGRDVSALTALDVVRALHTHGTDPSALPADADLARLEGVIDQAYAAAAAPLGGVTLKELAER